MRVEISDKEQSRIKQAEAYYQSQGLETEVKNLEIGDYIFDNKVVFEFKTIQDFIGSIQDNRVFNEAINQIENYDYHYVIIQGTEAERAKQIAISRNYQEVNYFQYLGAIASLNRYTTVIESYTPHIQEAFYRMLVTAKKCIQQKPIVKKFQRKHKNPSLNYLCYCVYGLNYKRASEIVHQCHLNTLEDLLNITYQDLVKIDGIGDKLAERILNTISEDSYES